MYSKHRRSGACYYFWYILQVCGNDSKKLVNLQKIF